MTELLACDRVMFTEAIADAIRIEYPDIPAYPGNAGWDFATGIGPINVTNLVDAWP